METNTTPGSSHIFLFALASKYLSVWPDAGTRVGSIIAKLLNSCSGQNFAILTAKFIVPGSEDRWVLLQWRGGITTNYNNKGIVHFKELFCVMWKYGVDHLSCETDERKCKYHHLLSSSSVPSQLNTLFATNQKEITKNWLPYYLILTMYDKEQ